MIKKTFLFTLMVLCFSAVDFLFAELPNEIVYQGRIKEYGQVKTETKTMRFRILDSLGNQEYTSGDQLINISSGIFSYTLTPNIDWLKEDYYIEITVGGKVLSPTEKITSHALSLHSGTAEDLNEDSAQDITMSFGGVTKAKLANTGEFKSFLSGTTYYMVPKGSIIMWSGTIANIPSGWELCDGDYGTPDLTDRFILSVADDAENPGAGGGANSYFLSADQLPSHVHNASSGNDSPDHSHGYSTGQGEQTTYSGYPANASNGPAYQSLSTGGASARHGHSITVNDSGQTRGSSIDNRPAYYKLAFIMKT